MLCKHWHKPTWSCCRAVEAGWGVPPPASRAAFSDGASHCYLQISSQGSVNMARRLALEEGLLVGISCGAAVLAFLTVGRRQEHKGELIITILPLFGERYLSSALFEGLRKKAEGMTAAVTP